MSEERFSVGRRTFLSLTGLGAAGATGAAGGTGPTDGTAETRALSTPRRGHTTESTYYVGTEAPTDASRNEFFYDTGTGEVFYHDGFGWHPFAGGETVIDVAAIQRAEGVTDDDEAFEIAYNRARDGDTILFRGESGSEPREYELAETHTISKSLTLRSANAELVRTSSVPSPAVFFRGGGLRGSPVAVTRTVAPGESRVSVADTGPFAVGDTVHLRNRENHTYAGQYALQFAAVVAVDGDELVLDCNAVFEFPTGEAYVQPVDLLDGPTVENLTMRGPSDDGVYDMFKMQWVRGGTFRGTRVDRYTRLGFYFLDCWDCTWDGVEATNAVRFGGGEGEPVKAVQSFGVTARDVTVRNCRRGIDIGHGTSKVHVENPRIERARVVGVGHHENGSGAPTRKLHGAETTVVGGSIHAEGTCILHQDGEMTVTGTDLLAGNKGLGVEHGEFTARDVTIRSLAGQGGGRAVTLMTYAGAETDFENVHVSGTVRDPTDEFVDDGTVLVAAVDGGPDMRNLHLDLDIDQSAGRFYKLEVNGNLLDGLTVAGRCRSRKSNTAVAFWLPSQAGEIRNMTWTADLLDHGGNGLSFYGPSLVENLRVAGARIDAGTTWAVLFGGGLGTLRNVWITDCHVTSEADTPVEVHCGDGPLWLVDNNLAGYVLDGVPPENREVRGNISTPETV
ncbi:hypothetical protein ACFO0N_03140 [Halobium salinum]|uniref:Right handed beta helix region n=1 Tax=Halobium salinum TaxID=1364940 RepID=A0ABD5P7V4_9EURY|nr:hypothetical protein [Halobium salinum]